MYETKNVLKNTKSDHNILTLAQFLANYTSISDHQYKERQHSRIICYRNYDMAQILNKHKRERVTLYIPFRNEEHHRLAEMKFIQIRIRFFSDDSAELK